MNGILCNFLLCSTHVSKICNNIVHLCAFSDQFLVMSQKRRADASASAEQSMHKKMRNTREQQRMQDFMNTSSGHSYAGACFLRGFCFLHS